MLSIIIVPVQRRRFYVIASIAYFPMYFCTCFFEIPKITQNLTYYMISCFIKLLANVMYNYYYWKFLMPQ